MQNRVIGCRCWEEPPFYLYGLSFLPYLVSSLLSVPRLVLLTHDWHAAPCRVVRRSPRVRAEIVSATRCALSVQGRRDRTLRISSQFCSLTNDATAGRRLQSHGAGQANAAVAACAAQPCARGRGRTASSTAWPSATCPERRFRFSGHEHATDVSATQ